VISSQILGGIHDARFTGAEQAENQLPQPGRRKMPSRQ
jgi:hypothetical protein